MSEARKPEQSFSWKETEAQVQEELKQTDIKGELEKLDCVLIPDEFYKQHDSGIDSDRRIVPFRYKDEDFDLSGCVNAWPPRPVTLVWIIERAHNCYKDEDVVKGDSIAQVFKKIDQLPPLNQKRPRKKRASEDA